jgi:hypothetical protein
LGHPKAIPSLKDLVRVYKPEIVLLIETLVHSNKIKDLCHVLGYDCSFVVDRDGRSGGLAVLWKSTFNCNIINFSSNFINLQVHDTMRRVGASCLFVVILVVLDADSHGTWNPPSSHDLASMFTDLWCIIGDFNDLLLSEDKRGGYECLS